MVSATLLGRLAVSERFRGQGLGEMLLMDALHRALQSSEQIASAAVVACIFGAGLFGVCAGRQVRFSDTGNSSRLFKGIHIFFNAIDDGLAHADSGHALG